MSFGMSIIRSTLSHNSIFIVIQFDIGAWTVATWKSVTNHTTMYIVYRIESLKIHWSGFP
jgi:hypothetical protein